MRLSQAGIDAIKRHEGLRLHAYLDSAGVPTIGYGHTAGVEMGQHISDQRAEEFLRADLLWAENAVNSVVRVPVSQAQYDALVSLTFNIGESAFRTSTLVQKLNDGDMAGAANEFLRWDKATVNGQKQVIPGLSSRRAAERQLFLAGVSAAPSAPAPTPPPQPADVFGQEHSMPIPAIAAALLPTLIESIPKLGKLFGSGSEVSERNQAAVGAVLDIVQTATKAVNAQEAVERIKADPAAQQAATKAVEARWFELVEGGGGGVDGARKADAVAIASGEPVWKSPSFIVAMALLPLVYLIVGAVVGLFGAPFSEDVRAAIANGIVGLILGGLIGYYYGQSTSRNRAPAAA